MELHPLEYHRILKSMRSWDGENTRVRSKEQECSEMYGCYFLFLLTSCFSGPASLLSNKKHGGCDSTHNMADNMAALQEFRCSVSMKVAFDRVGVDRNTISRTAATAELSLVAPEVLKRLEPWDEKEETLTHYAHRCRQDR